MSTGFSKGTALSIGRSLCLATRALTIVALLLPTAATAQTLAALPASAHGASTGAPARPISAWATFCERYAAECAFGQDEPAAITLTPALWQTINTVNRRVNRGVIAVTDQEHWTSPDRWDLAEDGSGDCEDFQLLKRRMLAEAGLPRRAMRMTVVVDEKGEGHAVLTIVTNRGDLILDNKTSAVLPWTQTGYTFVKRESGETQGWVSLGHGASPVTTANR